VTFEDGTYGVTLAQDGDAEVAMGGTGENWKP